MALRNAKRIYLKDFFGLQTFASQENLEPGWWPSSNNVIVSNDGSAEVLRSPANFNSALFTSNPVQSAFDYDKNSGNLILFDVLQSSSVATYQTTGTTNTIVRSGQANARWKRLTVNDLAYGLNGTEFVQTDGTNVYAVGIASASAAPSVSFVAGGSGSLASGITVSYAYRNSTTRHVSQPSPASASTGASGANLTLRVGVVGLSSTGLNAGVDQIVLFFTTDGGSVRYLYVNSSGDPVTNNNTTGNIDISLALLANLDTLTPETAYNAVPPQNANFMFRGRNDRIYLLDFRGATTRQQVQYNVFENCFYGIPWESWFATNILNVPNKGDAARGGIATPVGDLILSEQDAYLIDGSPTDKIAGPEGSVSITEHMEPLRWSIGTRSPYTLVSTPFGEMWFDQNKRIQLWNRDGFPVEAGLPIRTSLALVLDTDAARNMAEGVWFQHGKNGGHYLLSASTSGSTNNVLYIVSVYKDPENGQMKFACAISDIAAQCLTVAKVSGTKRLFIGATDRLRELMEPDTLGAGWSSTQTRFFSTVIGADDEFAYFHSLRFDASSTLGLTVSVSNIDGTESKIVELEQDSGGGGAYYAAMDTYGYRKIVTFTFNADDSVKRIIKNLRVAYSAKARLL